jgi:ppGpp synthetase/RelA/SpoT-type nucleotidyltranferase
MAHKKDQAGQWAEQYSSLRSTYQAYTNKLAELIGTLIEGKEIEVHQIEKRCKEVSSFRDKVTREGKAYGDPLAKVTDLAGVRVIAFYADDVERVCALIRDEFEVDEDNSADKRQALAYDQFGYLSTHVVVSLGDNRKNLPEWRQFAGLKAEVQVRTVLEHAWAAVSRKLQYNSPQEVPGELRRKLFRLSALFEVADEQFQELRDKSDQLVKSYEVGFEKGELGVEVNMASLQSFLGIANRGTELQKAALAAGWCERPDVSGGCPIRS